MMMMVKILSSTMVTPAEPTPSVTLQLPDSDRVKIWAGGPISRERLLFYPPHEVNNSVSSPIETLKASLSSVLVPYYPLAGRLNRIAGGRFELNCNAKGVLVVEAESDAQLQDLGDFHPTPEMSELGAGIAHSNDISELPMLSIQLTRFRCGGYCFAYASARTVVDGTSLHEFIIKWANIARGLDERITNIEPVHDQTPLLKTGPSVITTPNYMEKFVELNPLPILIGNQDDKDERMKETTMKMFKLSKEQVDILKKTANQNHQGEHEREYSRFEAISGHIWRCLCKARKLVNEQKTSMRTTVDIRKRLKPSLPPGYFGSATTITAAVVTSGELLLNPMGLGFACSVIRKSLDKVNDEYIRSKINFLGSQPDLNPILCIPDGVFIGNPNLSITSWARLPFYDVDFGWGNPIYMGLAAAKGLDGKVIIIPGGDEVGSFVVAVYLQVAHMDDFEELFYQIPSPGYAIP